MVSCQTSSPSAWAAEFELARAAATSDFERQVLADDEITRAEYEEAVQLYVECAHDAGVDISPVEQDGAYIYAVDGLIDDATDLVLDDCAVGTTMQIEGLYSSIATNPDNEDWWGLFLRCMKDSGLVEEDATLAEVQQAIAISSVTSDGEVVEQGEWSAPFPDDDPAFVACFTDPAGVLD